jgi:hypothetical protein
MNHVKILGLAAVVAAAFTAVVGAATASATELCSTATTPCSGTMYTPSTHVKAVNTTNAVLTTNLTTYTCTSSTLEGEATGTGGGTTTAVTGKTTAWTLAGCGRTGGEQCTVKATNLGTFSVTGGSANANAKFSYNITSNTGWNMTCGFSINCTFTTSSSTLAGQNQATGMPTIKAENIVLAREGGLCPEISTFTASYEIVEPTPLYVV